jgi:hypothetical protein
MTALHKTANPVTDNFYQHVNIPACYNVHVDLKKIPSSILKLVFQAEEIRQKALKIASGSSSSDGTSQLKQAVLDKPLAPEILDRIYRVVFQASVLDKLSVKNGNGDCFGIATVLLSIILDPKNRNRQDENRLLEKVDL